MDFVAADLGLMAYEVRWMLTKKNFGIAVSSAASFLGNYIWVDTTTQNNKNYLNQQLKQLISNNFRANQHPGAIRNLLLYIVMPYFRHFGSFVPKIWDFFGKWYIQHAEASVLQEFPRGCIFLKKVFVCRRLCRRFVMGWLSNRRTML